MVIHIRNTLQKKSNFFLDKNLKDNNLYNTEMVLNTHRPNIIFIILESWSADNIEALGGLKGITPGFKSLQEEGLLFTDFYSNGWTSDQAMSSIFSSFPVFPYVAIINQLDKARKLPSINESLNDYHSSYFFGGQLTYGNIKGYLLANEFDLVKDKNEYNHLPSGRLGVHDEYMFSEFKNELNKLREPFLSALFTISSHSPYDFPGEHKLDFNSKYNKYVNSVAYTDKCLDKFMNDIKNESWFSNSLFIIVADHSHPSPLNRRVAQKERYKIPMLWYGEVLKEQYVGARYSKMGSHIDIASTILAQLKISDSEYIWGNNLFDVDNDNAFIPYAFHKGYGLIRSDRYYAFSESYNKVFEHHANDEKKKIQIKKDAELFFQASFENYIDL